MRIAGTRAAVLTCRLAARRCFIQAVAGPPQVGKITLVRQVMEAERREARDGGCSGTVLVLLKR